MAVQNKAWFFQAGTPEIRTYTTNEGVTVTRSVNTRLATGHFPNQATMENLIDSTYMKLEDTATQSNIENGTGTDKVVTSDLLPYILSSSWLAPRLIPTGGLATQYVKGNGTLGTFTDDVRGTTLTGLSVATTTDVVAGDTILQAIGKLQGQLDSLGGASDLQAVTNVGNTTDDSLIVSNGGGTNTISSVGIFSTSVTKGVQLDSNVGLSMFNNNGACEVSPNRVTFNSTATNKVTLENTLLTNNRTYEFPDASGTIALTSDIPSQTLTVVSETLTCPNTTAGIQFQARKLGKIVHWQANLTASVSIASFTSTSNVVDALPAYNFAVANYFFCVNENTGVTGYANVTSTGQVTFFLPTAPSIGHVLRASGMYFTA